MLRAIRLFVNMPAIPVSTGAVKPQNSAKPDTATSSPVGFADVLSGQTVVATAQGPAAKPVPSHDDGRTQGRKGDARDGDRGSRNTRSALLTPLLPSLPGTITTTGVMQAPVSELGWASSAFQPAGIEESIGVIGSAAPTTATVAGAPPAADLAPADKLVMDEAGSAINAAVVGEAGLPADAKVKATSAGGQESSLAPATAAAITEPGPQTAPAATTQTASPDVLALLSSGGVPSAADKAAGAAAIAGGHPSPAPTSARNHGSAARPAWSGSTTITGLDRVPSLSNSAGVTKAEAGSQGSANGGDGQPRHDGKTDVKTDVGVSARDRETTEKPVAGHTAVPTPIASPTPSQPTLQPAAQMASAMTIAPAPNAATSTGASPDLSQREPLATSAGVGGGEQAAAAGPLSLSNVDVARLIKTAAGSELRVATRSEDFGVMTIHTVLGHEQMSAHISLESERLSSALSTHLVSMQEMLENRLGSGLGVRASVTFGTDPGGAGSQSAGHGGASQSSTSQGSGEQSGGQQQNSYMSRAALFTGNAAGEIAGLTTPAAFGMTKAHGRLDIRI